MNLTERFLAFAIAFEKTYVDDDWARLEPFFTEDAVYDVPGEPPLGGHWEGRAAVLVHLREVLVDFDKRFDSRITEIVGAPEVGDGEFAFEWRATYTLAGAPDLVIGGRERALFEDDRIRYLEDVPPPGEDRRIQAYLAEHLPD